MTKRLQDFEPLWPAEQRMADWIRAGNMDACRISDSLPAEDAPKEVRLRASFVRYLALGGCDACRVPRKGLLIRGAYIEGDGPTGAETLGFYLKDSNLPNDLALLQCRFPDLLMLRNISLGNLFLTGSCLRAGLLVDGLAAIGNMALRGLVAQGEVQLLGLRLGGNLDCTGALLAARPGGNALNIEGALIKGALLLRDGAKLTGVLNLASAEIGEIADDEISWPSEGNLILNGCKYGGFLGRSPSSAEARLRWLALQDPTRFGDPFWPQPYSQLEKVFRSHELDESADKVRFEKERLKRAASRANLSWPLSAWFAFLHGLHWVVNGYGYKPFRAIGILLLFLLLGWPVYDRAWGEGAFRPASPVILRSPEWSV